jgi:hypothetical protein
MESRYWAEFAARRGRQRAYTAAVPHRWSRYGAARARARGVGRPGRETAYGVIR